MILYQDKDVLVVEKPAGLLSVPGRGPDKQDCLISRLLLTHPEALVVHRLDQATSGLMIFALNKPAQSGMGKMFEHKEVEKEYEALLSGSLKEERGVVELYQRLDIDNRPYQIVDPLQGKYSLTEWEVLQRESPRITRVRFSPKTGRTHQLRVHARELGAPIVGDTLYGVGDGAPRMMLHATKISFSHPLSGEKLVFESKVPF